jgi:hypothetical protein
MAFDSSLLLTFPDQSFICNFYFSNACNYAVHLKLMILIINCEASHFAIPSLIPLFGVFLSTPFSNTLNLHSSLRITHFSSTVPSYFVVLNSIKFAAKSSYMISCTKWPNAAPDEAVTPGSVRSQAGCGAGGSHVSSER